jgi:hypothetical protein
MPVKLNKNAIERHEVIEIHFPVAQCALRAAIYRFVHFVSGRATARSKTHWSAGGRGEYRGPGAGGEKRERPREGDGEGVTAIPRTTRERERERRGSESSTAQKGLG